MGITIGIPRAEDKEAWRRLYEGYARFYRVPMPADAADRVWAWIHDRGHEVEGVVARDEATGRLVGLAHFRRMPSPLRAADIGFLDDLFVDPEVRGQGIGAALIAHVAQEARARGWPRLRWITAEDNAAARALYDRLARKTHWVTYEILPGEGRTEEPPR